MVCYCFDTEVAIEVSLEIAIEVAMGIAIEVAILIYLSLYNTYKLNISFIIPIFFLNLFPNLFSPNLFPPNLFFFQFISPFLFVFLEENGNTIDKNQILKAVKKKLIYKYGKNNRKEGK